MEKYTMFTDWKNQYSENEYTTQSNLEIRCNPYQATNGIFQRTRTNDLTICMEIQKTSNSQSNLEKEEWNWRNQPAWLQSLLACSPFLFLPVCWNPGLPISTDKWSHIIMPLYHKYRGESLFLAYICYLYSIDQIHNPDRILTILSTDLTSAHKWPAIGGPTTSDICLQQNPFCFSRQNSINNSYPQLGTIQSHFSNHTSHLSFPSGWPVYHLLITIRGFLKTSLTA